jgi:hypothetical protein
LPSANITIDGAAVSNGQFGIADEIQRRAVAELVGNEGGVVSGVFNLESSDVEASDWRPRHDKHYHEA